MKAGTCVSWFNNSDYYIRLDDRLRHRPIPDEKRSGLTLFPGGLRVQPPLHRFGLRDRDLGRAATPRGDRDDFGFGYDAHPAGWFRESARGWRFLRQGPNKLLRCLASIFRATQRLLGGLAGMPFLGKLLLACMRVAFSGTRLFLRLVKPFLP